jgi:hypothetical protein
VSTVAFIRKCLEVGMDFETALKAAEAFEASAPAYVPSESPGARRTRKWRENKASQTVTDRHCDAGDAGDAAPPPPSFPPEPPKSPTPTRECITTREERVREDAGFARFWTAYPRKTAKADARKAFTKAWKKLPPFDEEAILIGGLERAKASWGEAQFIPHAATWLNGERWQDEPPEVIQLKPRQTHERPHADAKFDRKQANLARAFAAPSQSAGQRWEP